MVVFYSKFFGIAKLRISKVQCIANPTKRLDGYNTVLHIVTLIDDRVPMHKALETYASACSKSLIRSSMSSTPTLNLIRESTTPDCLLTFSGIEA